MASEDAIKGTQNETETQSPDGLFLLSDIFSNCSSCCSFSLKINLQSMFTIKQKELKKSFARKKNVSIHYWILFHSKLGLHGVATTQMYKYVHRYQKCITLEW